ncbi:Gamma-tocopherol methyltransferase [Hyphodiscus hymeniophilus]|uniref:Gamma-tocopherol methyltransferase n=1 Tax=Hyphodiscus hymeniophilus TaxID=353542 RepID=A0A9P6VJV6_9HELO|nr:Gamma-tocopherol methyltransferase [Hyphodiscus hymeniophilus]
MTTHASALEPQNDATSEEHDISSQYETPAPEPFISYNALKDRIRHHYEICSDYYYSLWGEHIHHGYFLEPTDTKEKAQLQLIELLLERSNLPIGSTVLDVGCGIGGTSRYLAKEHGCAVTGVTISGKQVETARRLSSEAIGATVVDKNESMVKLGDGSVQFLELDAEKMGDFFTTEPSKAAFDCVWISEAMSHLPNKELFFQNSALLLNPGGKLVVADWFKAEGLTEKQMDADIKPIEDGMLLPPLCDQSDYLNFADLTGLRVFAEPFDISEKVSKTWDISWSLIQSPALWAFAATQGRDGLAFFQAFRAMRRGFANGTFRYAVMAFQK